MFVDPATGSVVARVTLTMLNSDDNSGNYTCVATNALGVAVRALTLAVEGEAAHV